MKPYALPRLRLSGTSFLLHAGYVPALRFTARRCDDVAVLLTEAGERGEGLPAPAEIREMARIAEGEGATLHVHLPTDADCDTAAGRRALVERVRRAAERAAPLAPHTFVLHVDFPSLRGTGRAPDADAARETAEALREMARGLPGPDRLAVENLEGYAPGFWDRWIEGTAFSRCLDVGHVWKDGGDPAPLLEAWLPRLRVIHLHGLEPRGTEGGPGRFGPRPRDHRSLRLMPAPWLDAVLHPLWRRGFEGVLNLEVFRMEDFTASHAALLQSYARFQGGDRGQA